MTGSCYRVLVDRMNRTATTKKNKMNKTHIKQTARNFGAVSFKTISGSKSKWLACYTNSTKDRDGLLRGLLDSGFAADTGHFGNQVDVKVA